MKVLRRPEVEARTGLSKPTIYRMVRRGEFPRQIRLSPGASGWIEGEVDEWIASRPRPGSAEAA